MNGKKSDNVDEHPLYLPSGTHVSAKFRGAFCEAKIKSVSKNIRVQVKCKNDNSTVTVSDEAVRGVLFIGSSVEVKLGDKKEYTAATIRRIQDMSQYKVDFDDGDEEILGRNSIVLKGSRSKGKRSQPSMEQAVPGPSRPRGKSQDLAGFRYKSALYKEKDAGKVVCVEEADKRKGKDNWYPALVLCPSTQENADIDTEKEYLVRSFIDGLYYIVQKDEVEDLTKEMGSKVESPTLRQAVEKAVAYMEKEELPPHWDKTGIFGVDTDTDSEQEDDKRDHFVAELYSFWDRCGIRVEGVPSIQKKQLDFYKFFRVVDKMGGYHRICHQKRWKDVAIKMGFDRNQQGNVKKAFFKYLLQYENMHRTLGVTLTDVLPTGTVMHRSIIREGDKLAVGENKGPAAAAGSRSFGNKSPAAMRKQVEAGKSSPVPEGKITVEEEEEASKRELRKKMKMDDDRKKGWNLLFRRGRKKLTAEDSHSEEEEDEIKNEEPDGMKESDDLKDDKVTGSPSARMKKGRNLFKRMFSGKEKSVKAGRVAKKSVGKKKSLAEKFKTAAIATLARGKLASQSKDNQLKVAEEAVLSPGTSVPMLSSSDDSLAGGKSVVSHNEDAKSECKVGADAPEKPYEASARTVKVGDVLMVLHGLPKKAYEAKVLEVDKKGQFSRFFIHYNGWNSRHDEWIKLDRIADNLSFVQRKEKRMSHTKKVPVVADVQSTSEHITSASVDKVKSKRKRGPKPAAGTRKKLVVASPEVQVGGKKEILLEESEKAVPKVEASLGPVETSKQAGVEKAAGTKFEETVMVKKPRKPRKRMMDVEGEAKEEGDDVIKTVKRNKSSLETKEELKKMEGKTSAMEIEEITELKGKNAKEVEGEISKTGEGSELPSVIRIYTGKKRGPKFKTGNPETGPAITSKVAVGMAAMDTIKASIEAVIHGTSVSVFESVAKIDVEVAEKDFGAAVIKKDVDPVKADIDPAKADVDPAKKDAGPSKEDVAPVDVKLPPVKSALKSVVRAFTGRKMRKEPPAKTKAAMEDKKGKVAKVLGDEATLAVSGSQRNLDEQKLREDVSKVVGIVDMKITKDVECGAKEVQGKVEEKEADKAGSKSDMDIMTKLHVYDYDETDEMEIKREFKRIISTPSTSKVVSDDWDATVAPSSIPVSGKLEGVQKSKKFLKQPTGVLVEEIQSDIPGTGTVCRPSEVEASHEVAVKEKVEMKCAKSALDTAFDVKIGKEVVEEKKEVVEYNRDSAVEGHLALESRLPVAIPSASHAIAKSLLDVKIRPSCVVEGNDEKISIPEISTIPDSDDDDDDDLKMVVDVEDTMDTADYGERIDDIGEVVKDIRDAAMKCEEEAEVVEVVELNNETHEIPDSKIVETLNLIQDSSDAVEVVVVEEQDTIMEESKEDTEISKVARKPPKEISITEQASDLNDIVESKRQEAPPEVKMDSTMHKGSLAINTNVLEGLVCSETIQKSPVMLEDAEKRRVRMVDLGSSGYACGSKDSGSAGSSGVKLAKQEKNVPKPRTVAPVQKKCSALWEKYINMKWKHVDPNTKEPLPIGIMEHPSIFAGQVIMWKEHYIALTAAKESGLEAPEPPSCPELTGEMEIMDWATYMMENPHLTPDGRVEFSKRVWDDYILAYNLLHVELETMEKRLKFLKRKEREGRVTTRSEMNNV